MLTSIHIQGFKNFKDTQITPLRKVNLILGGQNVGKTSLLEAVYLGTSPAGNAQRLPSAFRSVEGHDIQRFLAMTFKAQVGGGHVGLEVDLGDGLHGESLTVFNQARPKKYPGAQIGGWGGDGVQFAQFADVDKLKHMYEDEDGTIPTSIMKFVPDIFPVPLTVSVMPTGQQESVQLFDQVVLKRKKRILLDALRRIEPRLEDMHSLSPDGEQRVYLELMGLATAVPLPQLGHGFGRLLHLYCSLLVTDVRLALIDEVENGIHYASLPILFKGVQDMATTQGVQTLMTTHSWDCIRAAYKTFADAGCLQDFQLIRLEREGDNVRAVVINDDMLDTVMEAGYEVR